MDSVASWFVHRPLALAALAALQLLVWYRLRGGNEPRRRAARAWLWAGGVWSAFAAWELLVMLATPEANIRVDLLLIWPVVLLMTGRALFHTLRSTGRRGGTRAVSLLLWTWLPAPAADAAATAEIACFETSMGVGTTRGTRDDGSAAPAVSARRAPQRPASRAKMASGVSSPEAVAAFDARPASR